MSSCPLVKKKKAEHKPIHLCKLACSVSKHAAYIFLLLMLQWDQVRIPVKSLLDTGSCGNFVDSGLVSSHKIPHLKKSSPLSVSFIDGTTSASGPILYQT